MEKQEQQHDSFAQWGEFQRGFYGKWADAYSKMYQPWVDVLQSWQKKTPFAGPDLFSKWSEMIKETIGKAADRTEGGLGTDVLSRVMRASNIFVIFNEFWMEILKDLPEMYQAKGDDAKSREILERWLQRYTSVSEKLIGSPVSDTAQEMTTSWLNAVQMHQAAMGLMWNPWIQALPQWREQAERFMKGDLGALSENRSLWREVYDETLGRVFRMPAFGLTKAQNERVRKTYDAFVQFYTSLPNFYQHIHDTGINALKQIFEKVQDLDLKEITPETAQEVYRIWWTTNEDTFFELFKRPDFCRAMGEVLSHGLRLKKRLDDLSEEWCKTVNIPSNRDLDEVAMAIQDLRRKVHKQKRAIEELQRKIEKSA
ncbi:poly(R)-hydroxyalkanoic acid synthase subunit PhaE [Thermodesulfobacteriota bacterium]